MLHKIVGLNIVLCVGLLTSALPGRAEDTAPVHPGPWPIWNWRNHQPTQRELDELHKHDLSPEQVREVDRLYMQLEGSTPNILAPEKPPKR